MDTSERAQQYSIEDKQCIKSEVKTSGFVTNAGYKATLQRMVSKEINDETTDADNDDVSCQTNRSIMVPTDNRRRSLFSRMLSSGSARSTASTSNLSVGDNSSVSGSMASSKSWQSFSNLLDALELLPDDEDNMINNESTNANLNLAPRKLSNASITKEQQDELRREIKSSQNDMLRGMLFDDPRHELIPQQSTKSRKNDDSIDHSTKQLLQIPIEVTATKGKEEEGEQFDPQAFLDDLIYGKKGGSGLDEKKPIDSADTGTKKIEPIPFRLNKADEKNSENDSISLSSNDSFKDGDDCWLPWPKLEDESDVR